MNNQFFLLRNNKQSGPFSKEQLLQMGLAETDVICEAGKNEVWKTIGDFEALKDIIGKRNHQPNKADSTSASSLSNGSSGSKDTSDGSAVYIKLPYPTNNIQVKKAEVAKVTAVKPKGEIPELAALQLQKRPNSNMVERQKEVPSKKYERSLDDIKEEYSSWLKRQTISRRRFVSKPLIAAGLVIVISSVSFLAWQSFGSKEVDAKARTSFTQDDARIEDPSLNISNEPIDNTQTLNNTIANIPTSNTQTPKVVIKKNVQVNNTLKTSTTIAKEEVRERAIAQPEINKPEVNAEIASTPPSNPLEVPKVEKERPKTVSLLNLVDLKGNYVSSGKKGISDFNITINNRSNELLKLVAVDVYYYNQNKQVINKKTLYVNNLAGGDKTTINASADNNAVSAGWQLGLINSAEGAIHYAKQ